MTVDYYNCKSQHSSSTGSGRVTFNNQRSYLKAVSAAFVEIKTPKFTKKVTSLLHWYMSRPQMHAPCKSEIQLLFHSGSNWPLFGGLDVPTLQSPDWTILLQRPGGFKMYLGMKLNWCRTPSLASVVLSLVSWANLIHRFCLPLVYVLDWFARLLG